MVKPSAKPASERGVMELVEAIVDDTRDLVSAHVEVIRGDVSHGLTSLATTVTSSLIAFSIITVTALLAGIALATTLIALGLPAWTAYWAVTAVAGLAGFVLVQRARRGARSTSKAAAHVADRVLDDVAALQLATDTSGNENT